jgi:hypothetical protein
MPDDIIIDSRFANPDQLLQYMIEHGYTPERPNWAVLFNIHQNEIISKPGTYKATIERIVYNPDMGEYKSVRSDILSRRLQDR